MSIRQRGGRVAVICGLLLLLLSGSAAVTAADTDSPVVIAKVAADGDRMMVTLLNTAPYSAVIDGWQLSSGDIGTTLPTGSTLGGFARAVVPVALPAGGEDRTLRFSTPTGEIVQLLEDPVHLWTAGDIFSLHGVDRYRYIIAYSQDTDDERVHGCYEVDKDADGDWVVSQFVHGQEVFGDAFMGDEGARYLDYAPLSDVVITDRTPGNEGQSYYGRTLESLFGGVQNPDPSTTPKPTVTRTPTPAPTAPLWPILTPTAPVTPPTAAPTPEETVPVTPASTQPPVLTPASTPTGTTEQPAPTEIAATPEPTLEPAPVMTTDGSVSRFNSRRYAGWSRPEGAWGRQPAAPSTPSAHPTIVTVSGTLRSTGSFARSYPAWSWWTRS